MDDDDVRPIADDHAWEWAGKTTAGSRLLALTGTTPRIRVP
jgi:hypothetical protein